MWFLHTHLEAQEHGSTGAFYFLLCFVFHSLLAMCLSQFGISLLIPTLHIFFLLMGACPTQFSELFISMPQHKCHTWVYLIGLTVPSSKGWPQILIEVGSQPDGTSGAQIATLVPLSIPRMQF